MMGFLRLTSFLFMRTEKLPLSIFTGLMLAALLCASIQSKAEVYVLENDEDSVVGEIQRTWAESSDTLLDIARC